MSTCNFSHLIFDNNAKKKYSGKKRAFSRNVARKVDVHMPTNEIRLVLSTLCKKKKETSNGSGTYILNLTLLEENGCDEGIGKGFLNTAPFAQELRPATKIRLHKSQNLLHS